MDGTLVSSELDFGLIRAEAGVPDGIPILEFMDRATEEERGRVNAILLGHERRAAGECCLLPGAGHVVESLRERGLKVALLTRNSRESVKLVLTRLGLSFHCCVAREDARPKPSADPVLKIGAALHLQTAELLVVGDYIFDIQSGQRAGARTALLDTGRDYDLDPPPDIVVHDLMEILDHLPDCRTAITLRG